MPRSSSRRRKAVKEEEHSSSEEEFTKPSPRKKSKRNNSVLEDGDDVDDIISSRSYSNDKDDGGDGMMMMQFSQQMPEESQLSLNPRPAEEQRFESMEDATREKIITNLSRILMFKIFSGEPIDRSKVFKESCPDIKVIGNAPFFLEASKRLQNVFGFELKPVPEYLLPQLSQSKFKERYYAINQVPDDSSGSHSKALHSIHIDSAVEKGLLMLILAFAYCKGHPVNASRWISDEALYNLLHSVDANIPKDPPNPTLQTSSSSSSRLSSSPFVRRSRGSDDNTNETPNVDLLLDKFVHLDYLLKKKTMDLLGNSSQQTSDENVSFSYAMGPRAALEIGRRQVIYFCAEILDEQPDPTMLQEIETDQQNTEETTT